MGHIPHSLHELNFKTCKDFLPILLDVWYIWFKKLIIKTPSRKSGRVFHFHSFSKTYIWKEVKRLCFTIAKMGNTTQVPNI